MDPKKIEAFLQILNTTGGALKARLDKDLRGDSRIFFSGGRWGEHSIDATSATFERIDAHWSGYVEASEAGNVRRGAGGEWIRPQHTAAGRALAAAGWEYDSDMGGDRFQRGEAKEDYENCQILTRKLGEDDDGSSAPTRLIDGVMVGTYSGGGIVRAEIFSSLAAFLDGARPIWIERFNPIDRLPWGASSKAEG